MDPDPSRAAASDQDPPTSPDSPSWWEESAWATPSTSTAEPPKSAFPDFIEMEDEWNRNTSMSDCAGPLPTLPTIITGKSKAADSSRLSLLDLPGEIRNRIYDYALKYDQAIRVIGPYSYEGRWSRPDYEGSQVDRASLTVFLTCRQIYQEAVSRFVNKNIFVFSKIIKRHDPVDKFINLLVSWWLGDLGGQTRFMRELTIDLDALCPLVCWNQYGYPQINDVFSFESGLIEVHSLVRMIWNESLDIDISIIQPHAQAYQDLVHWTTCRRPQHHQPAEAFDCNAAAITQILKSLVNDQLGLQKYGRLVGGIGIKRYGSGVVFGGARSALVKNTGLISPLNMEGAQLRMLSSKPGVLLDLPKNIQGNIFRPVVTPEEGVTIDLDTTSQFQRGLLHTSRAIYETWYPEFINKNVFYFSMSSSEPHTDFSNFGRLRSLLRKLSPTENPLIEYEEPIEDPFINLLGKETSDAPQLHLKLNFDLQCPTSLEDLCINIMPFVMETSSMRHDQSFCVSISYHTKNGEDATVLEHHITFQDLRFTIAEALMDFINTTQRGAKLTCPEIWVNGLGIVDKSRTKIGEPKAVHVPDLRNAALLLDVANLSAPPRTIIKDLRYTHYYCKKCDAAIFESEFPYDDSAQLTLRYLVWVMKYNDDIPESCSHVPIGYSCNCPPPPRWDDTSDDEDEA